MSDERLDLPAVPDTVGPRDPEDAADPHRSVPGATGEVAGTGPVLEEPAEDTTVVESAPPPSDELPSPEPPTGSAGDVLDQRGVRGLVLVLVLAAVAMVGGGAYLAGQRSVVSPPGEVRVVDGASEALGYGVGVFKSAHESVVRVSVAGGGVGTGFFYAPNRLVTNAHVVVTSPTALKAVAQGETFTVDLLLPDGRQRTGEVIAADSRIDLAVIKVEEGLGVPVLPFATSADVVPGQPVAALGYPFGGELMMTTGVISGVSTNSRFAESDAQTLLLQTDAAVNPGNSGGPLVDASGAVLGVVTLRPDEADGRQVAGMTLAIPADVVVAALEQLEEDGEVVYPVVGVLLSDATVDHQVTDGAYVEDVTPGTGAAAAGLKAGDVIVAVDGVAVGSAEDVIEALIGRRPGERVEVTVRSGPGAERVAAVKLGSR